VTLLAVPIGPAGAPLALGPFAPPFPFPPPLPFPPLPPPPKPPANPTWTWTVLPLVTSDALAAAWE